MPNSSSSTPPNAQEHEPSRDLTVPELRSRGWSPSMIRDLLGDPDSRKPNPVFQSGTPMALYQTSRVENIESTVEFAQRRAQASRRAAAARRTAKRRRDSTLEKIYSTPINVPYLNRSLLAKRAVTHRNHRAGEQTQDLVSPLSHIEEIPETVLQRWEVNYLRHVLTPYDALLADLHGHVGRVEAEVLLRRRVYAAIAERYPHLALECDRQLAERLSIVPQKPS